MPFLSPSSRFCGWYATMSDTRARASRLAFWFGSLERNGLIGARVGVAPDAAAGRAGVAGAATAGEMRVAGIWMDGASGGAARTGIDTAGMTTAFIGGSVTTGGGAAAGGSGDSSGTAGAAAAGADMGGTTNGAPIGVAERGAMGASGEKPADGVPSPPPNTEGRESGGISGGAGAPIAPAANGDVVRDCGGAGGMNGMAGGVGGVRGRADGTGANDAGDGDEVKAGVGMRGGAGGWTGSAGGVTATGTGGGSGATSTAGAGGGVTLAAGGRATGAEIRGGGAGGITTGAELRGIGAGGIATGAEIRGSGGAATAAPPPDANMGAAIGCAKSSFATAPPLTAITPPQTEQRVRTPACGTRAGSTRKTERHSGQVTFMRPHVTRTGHWPARHRAQVRRQGPGGDPPCKPSRGESSRRSSFRLPIR